MVAPEDVQRRRAIVARVRDDFAAVLVHGDPSLIPLEASFPEAPEMADRLVYTGYVGASDEPAGADNDAGADEVLVSAGGGAVGGALLATALAARRAAAWPISAGGCSLDPICPAQFAALSAKLPDGVVLERYRADFPQMLRRCRVSVSQAGYNTVLDILAARANAVLVPFADLRETEQALRAERLADRGVVEIVAPRCAIARAARGSDRAGGAGPAGAACSRHDRGAP